MNNASSATLPSPAAANIAALATRSAPPMVTPEQTLWWVERARKLMTGISSLFASLLRRFFGSVNFLKAPSIGGGGQPELDQSAPAPDYPEQMAPAQEEPSQEEMDLHAAIERVASVAIGKQEGGLAQLLSKLESTRALRFSVQTRLQSGFSLLNAARQAQSNAEQGIKKLTSVEDSGLRPQDIAALVEAQDHLALERLGDPEEVTKLVRKWMTATAEVVGLQESISALSDYWLQFKLGTEDDLKNVAEAYGISYNYRDEEKPTAEIKSFTEAFNAKAEKESARERAAIQMVESAMVDAVAVPPDGVLSTLQSAPRFACVTPNESQPPETLPVDEAPSEDMMTGL